MVNMLFSAKKLKKVGKSNLKNYGCHLINGSLGKFTETEISTAL